MIYDGKRRWIYVSLLPRRGWRGRGRRRGRKSIKKRIALHVGNVTIDCQRFANRTYPSNSFFIWYILEGKRNSTKAGSAEAGPPPTCSEHRIKSQTKTASKTTNKP